MLVRAPYLFSLLLTLLLTPLAMADSIPVETASHTGFASLTAPVSTVSAIHNNSADFTVAGFASSSRTARADFVITDLNGNASSFMRPGYSPTQFGNRHGTISYPMAGWRIWRDKPTATPEPGSFLLVSTGLIGVAGLVRWTLKDQALKSRAL